MVIDMAEQQLLIQIRITVGLILILTAVSLGILIQQFAW